jgi:hypothetical protein
MENQKKSFKGRSIAQWVRTSKNSYFNAFQQFTMGNVNKFCGKCNSHYNLDVYEILGLNNNNCQYIL